MDRFVFHQADSIYMKVKKNEFAKTFIEKTKKLKLGDGMKEGVHLGPITTKKRLEEIEKLVEKTKKEGGKVLYGGKRPSGFNKGYFYEPTIIAVSYTHLTLPTILLV